MAVWQTPKTNWNANSRFNIGDMNRIKDNLNYLGEEANQIIGKITITTNPTHVTSYAGYWTVAVFNQIETDVKSLADLLEKDFGNKKTFYENGLFITYDELNRIESACLEVYNYIEMLKANFRKLPFRFGAFKDVRI